MLLALGDGRTIESVLLPGDGVCVSTQVGCAVGCMFCMTGRDGLARHLTSGEIVAQVALARTRQRVRRVVFMGMGEPAHNLDNVLDAITLLGEQGDLATKNLVFSTVGDRRVFERLPLVSVKPALALSLHTTKPELRAQLLPRAPRIEPAELVALADAYSRATKYPTQYQWTLLEGVNDGDDELDTLATLLQGHYAVVNFIPYNTVDGVGLPPAVVGARSRDDALSARPRRAREAAAFGGPGRRRGLRPAAGALRVSLTALPGCARETASPRWLGCSPYVSPRHWQRLVSAVIDEPGSCFIR